MGKRQDQPDWNDLLLGGAMGTATIVDAVYSASDGMLEIAAAINRLAAAVEVWGHAPNASPSDAKTDTNEPEEPEEPEDPEA